MDLLDAALRSHALAYPLRRLLSWSTFAQIRSLAAKLRSLEVDIVHTHGFYPNIFGIASARCAGVTACIASKRELRDLRSPVRAAVERAALSGATHVVANSAAIRQQLVEDGIADSRISTIYNAVSGESASKTYSSEWRERSTLTSPRRGVLVTMVANFHHAAKDHATFLRAARRVVDSAPDTRFVLAGEGPNLGVTEQLCASLRLGAHVQFPGHVADVASLLAITTIGVLTSRSEGLPNVILEYMAAACPVVATDVGGVSEAMIDGATGFVVEAGDDGAIADRILRLLSNDELRTRMGVAGRERVLTNFTLARQLQAIVELYQRALSNRPSTSR